MRTGDTLSSRTPPALFARVHRWARARNYLVPALTLRVGCPRITAQRRGGDKRAFMHVAHARGKVCATPLAATLSINHQVGLMLHEIGHPLATKLWGRSEQEDADEAVRKLLGVVIEYRSPLVLQWVSTHTVRTILRLV